MTRKEAVSFIKKAKPDAFLEKANHSGYVCPCCGNGTGRDGDGLVRYEKAGAYKCFKCGFHGDILDLVGEKFGLEGFNERLAKAGGIYGISIDGPGNGENGGTAAAGGRREGTGTLSGE